MNPGCSESDQPESQPFTVWVSPLGDPWRSFLFLLGMGDGYKAHSLEGHNHTSFLSEVDHHSCLEKRRCGGQE